MKCWLISDTHNHHRELNVPLDLDVVMHCGDESECGNEWLNEPEARDFFEWYASLDIPVKIYTPGNHSTAVEQGLIRPEQYPNIRFLIHGETDLFGLKVFGTPYTPKFFDWAYMRARKDLDVVWQSIPDDVDILISHGPPKGILDVTHDFDHGEPTHVGSKSLTRHVKERIKPMIHAFGHIHDEPGIRNYGVVARDGILFVNCSCCNIGNRLVNHGILIEIEAERRALLQILD